VASSVYGWIVTASIFLFVWNVFKPYRLEVLGKALAFGALWGLVVRPVQGMIKFLKVPGRSDEVKQRNVIATGVVAAAVAAAVGLIPLPQRVWCAAELEPRGAETVYVPVAGTLEEQLVRPGVTVRRGDVLARLSNIDLDLQIAELAGKVEQYKARVRSLDLERFTDPAAALEIATAEQVLSTAEETLAAKEQQRRELVLVAPRDGVVLPAARVKPQPDPGGKLPAWSGDALDPRNLGGTLVEGTILCLVGDPAEFDASLVVDQSEVEFVHRGQPVALRLNALAWQTFTGTVAEIAETHIETGSERLSVKAGGAVPTETDASGREVPISTSYEAKMTVDDAEGVLTAGMRGTARIEVGRRTVGEWLLRVLWKTFNFRM